MKDTITSTKTNLTGRLDFRLCEQHRSRLQKLAEDAGLRLSDVGRLLVLSVIQFDSLESFERHVSARTRHETLELILGR